MIGIPIFIALLLLGALIWYVFKGIEQISTKLIDGEKIPVQAIITVWGKAKRAVGQGFFWLWWPRDKIGLEVPMTTYHLKFNEFPLHTKKTEEEAAKPVRVGMTIHVNLPRVGQRIEIERSKIPSVWLNCVGEWKEKEIERDGNKEEIEVGIIKGESLLVNHLYHSLPPSKLFDCNAMAAFFKDASIAGVRAMMVVLAYTEGRQQQAEIEQRAKEYFLADPANLFVKCGIPPENIDISITFLESTEEVEKSLYAVEIAEIDGIAAGKGIAALISENVDPQIAAMLVKGLGREGGSIDLGDMANMGIALKLFGFEPLYKRSLSTDSIEGLTDVLGRMPAEEEVIMKRVLGGIGINL